METIFPHLSAGLTYITLQKTQANQKQASPPSRQSARPIEQNTAEAQCKHAPCLPRLTTPPPSPSPSRQQQKNAFQNSHLAGKCVVNEDIRPVDLWPERPDRPSGEEIPVVLRLEKLSQGLAIPLDADLSHDADKQYNSVVYIAHQQT